MQSVMLVVPGRKSDVQDAEWGCQLLEHGLVRPSLVPPRPLREPRDLVRYRKAKIQERTREVQRVEKSLQDAGIKLSSVASEVLGVSARKMLDALCSAPTTRRSSPSSPRGRWARRSLRCAKRCRAGSPATTRS
jgi:transposase